MENLNLKYENGEYLVDTKYCGVYIIDEVCYTRDSSKLLKIDCSYHFSTSRTHRAIKNHYIHFTNKPTKDQIEKIRRLYA